MDDSTLTSEALSDLVIQLSENGKTLDTDELENVIEGDEIDEVLVSLARTAKEKAFAPHSDFPVGAALLTEQGIYLGGNVEVSGRSTSVHAEMLAAYNAAFEGAEEFRAMSVSTPRQCADTGPCGLCQHTLSQFTDELRIIEDGGEGEHGIFYLSELIGDGYSASTRHSEYVTDKQ
jgi:cytidine deaminase